MSSRTWCEWYTGTIFTVSLEPFPAGHHTFREWLDGTLIETSRAVWFGAKRQPPGVSFELFQFKFLPKGNGSWWNCFRNCRFSHRSVTVSSKSPNELNHASTRLPLSRLGNNFLKESPQDGPYRSMQRNIPIKAFCWSPFIDAAQGCKCIAEVNFPSSCSISLGIKMQDFCLILLHWTDQRTLVPCVLAHSTYPIAAWEPVMANQFSQSPCLRYSGRSIFSRFSFLRQTYPPPHSYRSSVPKKKDNTTNPRGRDIVSPGVWRV